MSELPRLTLVATVDLPVLEASGLATRVAGGELRVLVVGDRTHDLGAATYDPATHSFGQWQTIDVATLDGWPHLDGDSQFEAIAADGGSLVAVMREDPPVVLVGDTTTRSLRARITLTAPGRSPLHARWGDPSSRGEGLLLLRGGRLLVAKEKRPRALVEFAPVGAGPHGVSRYDFLGPDESWDAPYGEVDFEAAAMWRLRAEAKDALGDISAIAAGHDGSLWLLSDKSRCVARLPLQVPLRPGGDEITELAEVWALPDGTEKPEGIAALEPNRVLVAMDTRTTRGNGLVVARPP